MKKYLRFSIIVCIMFLGFSYVHAESCDANDIKRLKEIAGNIDITYEDNNKGSFNVTFDNISDEFSIYGSSTGQLYILSNVIDNKYVVKNYPSGNHNFEIYSISCDVKLKVLSVKIFKTNIYASDPLCKGHEDLNVCKVDFDTSSISREEFIKIINGSESLDGITDANDTKHNNELINIYLSAIGGVIFLIIIIMLVYTLNRTKKGELKWEEN